MQNNQNDRRINLFAMREYTDKQTKRPRTAWTRIGAAFRNRDGSFTLEFDALPVSGRCHMREETLDDAREREQRQAERQRGDNYEQDQRDGQRRAEDNDGRRDDGRRGQ